MEKAAIVSVLALCVIGFGSGFHVSYDDCGKLHSFLLMCNFATKIEFRLSLQLSNWLPGCGWFQCKKKTNKVLIIPLYNEWAAFHWIKLRDSGRWSMTSLNIQRRSLERLHMHFHLYVMFVLARNTFPFLEHNSSKRRESKPFQKQY